MDTKLNREFVYVHRHEVENEISCLLVDDLLKINDRMHCTVTEYDGSITISCQSVAGLGDLALFCSGFQVASEGPELRLFVSLQKAIAKFVG